MRSAALMRFAQRMQAKGRAAADMSKNRGKTGAAMTGPRAKLFCPRASAAPALLQTQLTPSPASTAAQVSTEAKHKQRAQGLFQSASQHRSQVGFIDGPADFKPAHLGVQSLAPAQSICS
ncbi:TPA: hypothetical protein ACH3X2_000793 [Trebouxia sp. C0005]